MDREFSTPVHPEPRRASPARSEPFLFPLFLLFLPSVFCLLQSLLQVCPFVFNHFQDAHPATLFFSSFCIVAGGAYTPAARTLHKMTPIPKIEENTMNDTLNPEASATIIAPEAAESAEASIPTETPQHSPKRRDDPSRCHYRYPNGRRCTLPGLPAKSGLFVRPRP